MPTEAPDIEARRTALRTDRSFIVRAPAGSGKTELLIQRILALLAVVEAPEEIIAVTFTRKAASEMRARVLDALAAANTAPRPAAAHQALTYDLAHAALERDRHLQWQLASNPARLRIQTIDSLAASLARQLPITSRLGAMPAISDQPELLYQQAARATVQLAAGDDATDAEHAQSIARLLRHLDNDVGRVEAMLTALYRRRDQWARLMRHADREHFEAVLGNARREALQEVRGRIHTGLDDELLALLRYAGANLMAAGNTSPIARCGDLQQLPGIESEDAELWLGIVELLVAPSSGSWRKRHIVSEGFPPGATVAEKTEAKCWKERASALITALCDDQSLCRSLHALRELPPARYSDLQWEILSAIVQLLPRALAELKLIFASEGQADFPEITAAAIAALGEAEAPTDLALALDARIRHFLVDEFQDTSITQFQLIERLCGDWSDGDGRSLFIVGDPMQSIYRFREAEVGLFLRAADQGIGAVTLQALQLTANFRSQAGIVEWVNQAFAKVLPAKNDSRSGAVSYESAVPVHAAASGIAVTVHGFAQDARSAEAQKVVQVLREVQDSDPAATTAILVRGRRHLLSIVPALREAGISFEAVELDPLASRPAVLDALALTRALLHRADRVAWLAILRAPWCGLSLADLSHLVEGAPQLGIWQAAQDTAQRQHLSADGQARLQRFCRTLLPVLALRGRAGLRDSVEALWHALGGPACYEGSGHLNDVAAYFDHLSAAEQSREGGIAALETSLHRLFAAADPAADGKVQVMTIHRAKGLEFDHVIVPGLDSRPGGEARQLLVWLERPALDGEKSELLLAPIEETGSDRDPICRWIARLQRERARHENQRLLYVAATRARQRLHWMTAVHHDAAGKVKRPSDAVLLAALWPAVVDELAKVPAPPIPENEETHVRLPVDQSLRRLPLEWAAPPRPAPMAWQASMAGVVSPVEFSWAGETARRVGTVVHRWLQRIGEDALQGWDAARIAALATRIEKELIAIGLAGAALAAAQGRVLQALSSAISDARGRWLLGPHPEARSEHRLTVQSEQGARRLVIDRLIVDENGKRWIIDYKTGTHEGADVEAFLDSEQLRYRAQLETYARAIDPDAERALFFPLLSGWRQWKS